MGSNPESQVMPIKVTRAQGNEHCNYHVLICFVRGGWARGTASVIRGFISRQEMNSSANKTVLFFSTSTILVSEEISYGHRELHKVRNPLTTRIHRVPHSP